MTYVLDGYCGLYCGACPDLLDTQAGKAKHACRGCKSSVNNPEWCAICDIKSCAREKKIAFCYQCDEYPCEKITSFIEDAHYPYHREVTEYMKIIEREGKQGWLEKMKVRWSCGACRQPVSWWQQACPHCGGKVDGYEKP
jgi:hypothetical protein